MRGISALRYILSLLSLSLSLTACESPTSGDPQESPTGRDPDEVIATIEITPVKGPLFRGESVQFQAVARDSAGNLLRSNLRWSVIPATYTTVDTIRGVMTVVKSPQGPFAVKMQAVGQGIVASSSVTIYPTPVDPFVFGTSRILTGRTAQLTFGGTFLGLVPPPAIPAERVSWISSDPTVVAVSQTGVITAGRTGTATIRAELAPGASASLDIETVTKGYRVTYLGDGLAPTDLNDRAEVVGWFESQPGKNIPHAFVWRNGSFTDLGQTDVRSQAYAINNKGVIAGLSIALICCATIPRLWPAAWVGDRLSYHLPIPLSQGSGWSTDITDEGVAANNCGLCPMVWQIGDTTNLTFRTGNEVVKLAQLAGITSNGQMAGSAFYNAGAGYAAYLFYKDGRAQLIATGRAGAEATAINEAGYVVGVRTGMQGSCSTCGFIWSPGNATWTDLSGQNTTPLALNERGQVVGATGTAQRGPAPENGRGLLWEGGKMVELSEFLADPDWLILTATGINEAGQIVGQAKNARTGQIGGVLLTAE